MKVRRFTTYLFLVTLIFTSFFHHSTLRPLYAQDAKPAAAPTGNKPILLIASTSTLKRSGLLDYLINIFEAQSGIPTQAKVYNSIDLIKVGEEGKADVLLMNNRKSEDGLLSASHGVRRIDMMSADYVIVGPADDPANIQTSVTAIDAFTKIARRQVAFISRGDNAALQNREKTIWKLSDIAPAGPWFVAAKLVEDGLALAEKSQAYTLTERTAYLTFAQKGSTLKVLLAGDIKLMIPYGAVAVNPAKGPQIHSEQAKLFLDWLSTPETQKLIEAFGQEDFGQQIYFAAGK